MSEQASLNQTGAQPAPSATRRRFYLEAIYGLWALIGAVLSIPAFVYLFFPPKANRGGEWVDAADLSKIPTNSPEEVVFRRNRVDGWKVTSEKATAWVVKTSDSQAVAFAPQCTHLGCAYHWEAAKSEFLCPCHSSEFGPDGRVISGPAPRPLDRYESRTENGKLFVRTLKESEPTA
jgi:menaquinol-cytochrome c reductase iron-sulfur subunit